LSRNWLGEPLRSPDGNPASGMIHGFIRLQQVTIPVRVFLLSPASTAGKRAQLLFNPAARFDLALRLQAGAVPLGEVFSFLSGLYFRGKLNYARRFATSPDNVRVITSTRGLVSPDAPVTLDDLRELATGAIDLADALYREALTRDATTLRADLTPACEVVLLGSIATDKYVTILGQVFGDQLCFPVDFVGRGDMSRGGLMLRRVADEQELEYAPVQGAKRSGGRPAKLEPLPRPAAPAIPARRRKSS
jgi:hypothetical protein